MATKKSNNPNKVSKGILSNKRVAVTKKGNNPSPVKAPRGRKTC